MDQLQIIETAATGQTNSIPLTFSGLIKEIVFVLQKQKIHKNREYFNFTNSELFMEYYSKNAGSSMLKSANMTFNGENKMDYRDDTYFNPNQPYEHHSWIPKTGIFSYSFGLEPEKVSPTGVANFNKFENIVLNLNIKQEKENWEARLDVIECRIYAKSVNFIIIQDGYASKAYLDTVK